MQNVLFFLLPQFFSFNPHASIVHETSEVFRICKGIEKETISLYNVTYWSALAHANDVTLFYPNGIAIYDLNLDLEISYLKAKLRKGKTPAASTLNNILIEFYLCTHLLLISSFVAICSACCFDRK